MDDWSRAEEDRKNFEDSLKSRLDQKNRKRQTISAASIIAVVLLAGFVYWRYFTPIDLSKAAPDRLVGWLLFHDLSKELPQTAQQQTFKLYFDAISTPDPNNDKRYEYKLPVSIARYSSLFLKGRDDKVRAWRAAHNRLPVLRVDYAIVAESKTDSEYITSNDVAPGPALVKRWKERAQFLKKGSADPTAKKLTAEKNINLLIYYWFLSRLDWYDQAPDAEKKQTLDSIVDDLNNFQAFYNDLRVKANLRPLTRAAMLREFDMTIDGWLEIAHIADLARVLWFKDMLVAIVVSQTAAAAAQPQNDAAENGGKTALIRTKPFEYPPRKPSANEQANEKDEQNDAASAIAPFCEKATDALKGYLFK